MFYTSSPVLSSVVAISKRFFSSSSWLAILSRSANAAAVIAFSSDNAYMYADNYLVKDLSVYIYCNRYLYTTYVI